MQYLQWVIKGMAMGAADVVPGVSGGTLAFILGIYQRLLAAISAFNFSAVKLFRRGQFKALWQHLDGTFLLCLFSGILLSIFALAGVISYFLQYQPVPLWALFTGLILAALPSLCRSILWSLPRLVLCLLGIVFAIGISLLTPTELEPQAWMYFFAGAIAICAMILPGISGSFILLILGMYSHVLLAVTSLQLTVLALFCAGCVTGLLSFSRLLNWLLARFHDASLAFLIGIVVGALYRIWPWQWHNQLYYPWTYPNAAGKADILLAAGCALAGVIIMLLLLNLERWLGKPPASSSNQLVD
jgi:putative membrane protein